MNANHLAILFCAISFFIYGATCLYSNRMVIEFERYGLSYFRRLIGVLQLLGAIGLLVGFFMPWIGAIAATGLCLQMVCGLGVRIKIRDSWVQCLPAAFYMALYGWIAIFFLKQ